MTFLITVSLAVFAAFVLVWVMHRLKRKFPVIPLPSRLVRIGTWTDRLIASEGDPKTATFGDLVLFVTLWVIAFTLWFEFQKGGEEKYKEELDKAQTNSMSLEGKLRDQEQRFQNLQVQIGLPLLKSPKADEQIIGDHVDLQWESRQADSGQDYVIEVTQIAGNPGKVPLGTPCMYQATSSPAGSRYPISADAAIASGTYIWRVGLGNLQVTAPAGWDPQRNRNPQEDICVRDESIRKWSEYSKFTVYSTQKERLFATGEVLVGTSFNQSTPFSKLGYDGKASGFEIELVQTIIQECIVRRAGEGRPEIQYDREGCDRKVKADLKRIEAGLIQTAPIRQCAASDCTLQARIIELGGGDDWREKMQRHNLDLYVGTLTLATSREKGDIHFTSGYLAFQSELLTNSNMSVAGLGDLRNEKKVLGALTNSTNEWLAQELLKDFPEFSLQLFSSVNDLESAFEQKRIDLIIVDGILERSMRGVGTKVAGLDKSAAWRRYLRDRLGYGTEKFGIAVADDVANANSTQELRTAINAALNDEPIKEWINYLYDYYDLGRYGATRCNYQTDSCWGQ